MLWSGLKALVRNSGVFGVFLGADVAGQAVLVWAVPIESAVTLLWVSSLVLSLLWHVLCAVFLLCAAVESAGGAGARVRLRHVWVGGSRRLFPIAVTLVCVGAVVVVGLAVFTWVGVAAALALALVPLASAGGAPDPLRAGLSAIAGQPLGYAWVVVVGTVTLGAVSGAVALVALFWPTPLAQVVVMAAQGVVVMWLACSLAPTVAEGEGR